MNPFTRSRVMTKPRSCERNRHEGAGCRCGAATGLDLLAGATALTPAESPLCARPHWHDRIGKTALAKPGSLLSGPIVSRVDARGRNGAPSQEPCRRGPAPSNRGLRQWQFERNAQNKPGVCRVVWVIAPVQRATYSVRGSPGVTALRFRSAKPGSRADAIRFPIPGGITS